MGFIVRLSLFILLVDLKSTGKVVVDCTLVWIDWFLFHFIYLFFFRLKK